MTNRQSLLSLTSLLSSHPQTRSFVRSPRDLISEAVGIMMRRALAPAQISNQRAYTSSCMTLPFNLLACNSVFPFLFPSDSPLAGGITQYPDEVPNDAGL